MAGVLLQADGWMAIHSFFRAKWAKRLFVHNLQRRRCTHRLSIPTYCKLEPRCVYWPWAEELQQFGSHVATGQSLKDEREVLNLFETPTRYVRP